ncbi:unnamed protein product [Rotaria sp. Silwood2]|nr:unnamed protein product [Rotaria sp. Silwood2]CAF4276921.1 unnamed protein product [Rotaria sp. Silwood2]
MKPFQPKTTKVSSPKQSTIRFLPPSEFPSLPSTLSYLPPDCYLARSCSQPNKHERTGETLLERGQRLLGLCSEISPSSSISSNISKSIVRLIERHISPTDNLKRVLIEEIKSCLNAIDCAREAADDFCRFNELGNDRDIKLQRLFQLHSTAYYLKSAISSQLKMASNTNISIAWTGIVNSIDALKASIAHEQLLKEKTGLGSEVKNKIDLEASIALSAKLLYQLTRISI